MTAERIAREIQTKQAELQCVPPTVSLILSTWLVLAKLAKREKLTVGDLWNRYLEHYAKPHLKTWRNSERCFESYFAPLKYLDCELVTRLEVQRWYTALGQEVGWTTANRALELLCSIYNRCIDWEVIPARNPASRIKKKRLLSRERYLQPNELSRFFAATATLRYETTRDFFHMLLFTGQRAGNVRNMLWSEIDFDLKIWHIPMTKNGTSHKLPLTPEAMAILKRRHASHRNEWVFPGRPSRRDGTSAGPIGKNGCRDSWLQVIERADLPDLRMHDLRRTHATYQAINGANILAIAHTLNHKDLSSTQIYARMHLDPVRESMNTAVSDMCERAGLEKVMPDGEVGDILTRLSPAMPAEDSLVDAKEAAAILGLSEQELGRLRQQNCGPPYMKQGVSVRYSRRMLVAWSHDRLMQKDEKIVRTPKSRSKRKSNATRQVG